MKYNKFDKNISYIVNLIHGIKMIVYFIMGTIIGKNDILLVGRVFTSIITLFSLFKLPTSFLKYQYPVNKGTFLRL